MQALDGLNICISNLCIGLGDFNNQSTSDGQLKTDKLMTPVVCHRWHSKFADECYYIMVAALLLITLKGALSILLTNLPWHSRMWISHSKVEWFHVNIFWFMSCTTSLLQFPLLKFWLSFIFREYTNTNFPKPITGRVDKNNESVDRNKFKKKRIMGPSVVKDERNVTI